ncbi:MAG: hypothetical protein ACYSTZ_01825 [Planctomycetota bacterium]|jgi:hypothetical protein
MGFDLCIFRDERLEPDYVEWLVDERAVDIHAHFTKLWEYYTNPVYEVSGSGACDRKVNESGRCYRQAQEYGLPARITGFLHSANSGIFGARCVRDVQRKEVVVENDIAWRINAAIDFLFGKPVTFVSRSPAGQKRAEIESILKAVFEANGDVGFFQDMAVLGSVYGFVDCFVRPGIEISEQFTSSSSQSISLEDVRQLARKIGLELVEAPRALPVLEENDYRKTTYYVQHFYQKKNSLRAKSSFLSRLLSGLTGDSGLQRRQSGDSREVVAVTEITSASAWQRYENKQLVAEGELPWGRMS